MRISTIPPAALAAHVKESVATALAEDLGDGDITAALLDPTAETTAEVLCRERAILCGRDWVEEVFRALGGAVRIQWLAREGEVLEANSRVLRARGPVRDLLSGERTALNFLQLLSGVATKARRLATLVVGTGTTLLDTRKTLPGLRLAQKYAVACGGCDNHRLGLYDAFLLKENHLTAMGGVAAAVAAARRAAPDAPVEVEVADLVELEQAIAAGADRVMLDNFAPETIGQGVALAAGRVELEASGGLGEADLEAIASTGVNYISLGELTKHCRAIDFSMGLVAD